MLFQVPREPSKCSDREYTVSYIHMPFTCCIENKLIKKSEHTEAFGQPTAWSRWSGRLQEDKLRHVLTGPKGWPGCCPGPCTPRSSEYEDGSQGT